MSTNPSESAKRLEGEEAEILQEICEELGLSADIVERMIAAESQVYGMGRRHGIWEMLELLVQEGVAEGPAAASEAS